MMYDLGFSELSGTSVFLFILLLLWSLFWKGLALWHSARGKQSVWFIVLLLINTMGILELIYLFFVAKKKPSDLFKS